MSVLDKILLIANDPSGLKIYAQGPLTKQPSTVAYRTIIACNDMGFIVCDMFYPKFPYMDSAYREHSDVFAMDDFAGAVEKFGNRIRNSAACMDSLYREEPIEITSYQDMCDHMRSRKYVSIKGHVGMINKIEAEDASGNNWNVYLHNKKEGIFVKF